MYLSIYLHKICDIITILGFYRQVQNVFLQEQVTLILIKFKEHVSRTSQVSTNILTNCNLIFFVAS